ncbi:MAG: ferredoxin [Microbacteriaceae bacterium]|nr:ferredoxin [Microbacteriaceae bacterium]
MRLQVRSIESEAVGVLAIEFSDLDGGDLPAWEPGAHIDLLLDDDLIRQYSLCSNPADLSTYRIAVLLEQAGRGGSQHVHSRLAVGDVLTALGPKNHFELEPASDYLFVAGGIGITALMPMIAKLKREGKSFSGVYLGRSRKSMAFIDEVADDLAIAPSDEAGRTDVASLVNGIGAGTLVYTCGPESLLAAIETACESLAPDTLHVERFAVLPLVEVDGATQVAFEEEKSFEVYLEQSDVTVTVGADQTVLDALESVGADIYSDCREGICSTCETVVIEGIVDHRDHVLSAKERESNKLMMVCVSRASSPRLVLDL